MAGKVEILCLRGGMTGWDGRTARRATRPRRRRGRAHDAKQSQSYAGNCAKQTQSADGEKPPRTRREHGDECKSNIENGLGFLLRLLYVSAVKNRALAGTERRENATASNKANFRWGTYLLTRWRRWRMMLYGKITEDFAEVTGDWCCPWSSKPVWGREGPGWVRFPFASAILARRVRR